MLRARAVGGEGAEVTGRPAKRGRFVTRCWVVASPETTHYARTYIDANGYGTSVAAEAREYANPLVARDDAAAYGYGFRVYRRGRRVEG
jgi:hypothetical protein